MALASDLDRLEASGLVRPARPEPDLEYAFRHALVQDAAYESLLRQDRRRLHRAVAEVLERTYPERVNELAPLLAHHFALAADDQRALRFSRLAADHAMQQYALPEAVAHYSRAVELAERQGEPLAPLYRARGRVHELAGEFALARADLEAAVRAANAQGDGVAECEALLDLGLLWSGRDYDRAGEHVQRALALARTAGDDCTLAHSLNRVGNWHLNRERPQEALRLHQEALGLFEAMGDRGGLAETLDLLGITCGMLGEAAQSRDYYLRAIDLFRELDHRFGLASSLATLPLCLGGPVTEVCTPAYASLTTGLAAVDEALAVACGAGMRSAEAFARMMGCFVLTGVGALRQAIAAGEAGLALAEEIEHRQWVLGNCYGLGLLHAEVLALDVAQRYLERARELARETGSPYWIRCTGAALGNVLVARGRPDDAWSTLHEAYDFSAPAASLAERLLWSCRARVHLARGERAAALGILDDLARAITPIDGATRVPRLELVRAQALAGLGRLAEAESALRVALDGATLQEDPSAQWRIGRLLARVQRARGRADDAEVTERAARAVIASLAAELDDPAVRAAFLAGAAAWPGGAEYALEEDVWR